MTRLLVSQPSFMVDWLTVELPDPVGIPVNSGQVVRVSRQGEIEWMSPARLSVEGSWSSNMTFRAIGGGEDDVDPTEQLLRHQRLAAVGIKKPFELALEVSGNPAKFLTGHNLFGSADVSDLLARTIIKAKDAIWPDLFENPEIDFSKGLLKRIDLTASLHVERETDVLPILRAMEQTIWCPYRGRGVFDAGGSTLYYGRSKKGQRAKDWALKLYWKGPEVSVHPLPEPAYRIPGLLDELNRTIRVELTLRTPELKRLGLVEVGQWTPAKVREIWEEYVGKLDFQEAKINLDTVDLGELGLKPRHLHALAAWKSGNDLRAGMSKTAFYRLRKEIKDATGHDIASLCLKSNVVPLRRLVYLTPACVPTWADQLTAALESAA